MKARSLSLDGSAMLDSFAVSRNPSLSALCSWIMIKSRYLDRALSCSKNNTKEQQQELMREFHLRIRHPIHKFEKPSPGN